MYTIALTLLIAQSLASFEALVMQANWVGDCASIITWD